MKKVIFSLFATFAVLSANAQAVSSAVDYQYDNNGFVVEEKTTESNGDIIMKRYVYPSNIWPISGCGGTIYDPVAAGYHLLLNKNILSVPIETYTVRKKPNAAEEVISGTLLVYSSSQPQVFQKYELETSVPISGFQPLYVDGSCTARYSSAYVLQETYDSYDIYGNVLQKTGKGNVHSSFLYGYKGAYCTAIASNAASNEIAYTSFEKMDDLGGWSYYLGNCYTPTPTMAAMTLAGKYAYDLSGTTLTKTGLPQKKYIVSFWCAIGNVSVSGSVSHKVGLLVNGWTYHEFLVAGSGSGVTSVTISTSGTAYIDELRLYPYDAAMFTYRYNPLVGVAAQCDQKNKFTFYDYDVLNRLEHIYDQYGNITKKFEYRLQQPE